MRDLFEKLGERSPPPAGTKQKTDGRKRTAYLGSIDMKTSLVRLTFLALLVLGFSSTYAVEDADAPSNCFGQHYLGWLDVEFYWRENTTWYKLDTNDFYSVVYGDDPDKCSIFAFTEDKSTVSQGSVPSICQASSSGDKNSCLVFQAKQWLGDSNHFYRANLGSSPTDWSKVESWLTTYAEDSLTQRVWDQKVESTGGGPWLYYFVTTNHTDFQNLNSSWVPENDSWNVHSKMKDLEVKIRTYIYPYGYSWLWYETYNRADSFQRFVVGIYQVAGGDSMAMGVDEDATPLYSQTIGANETNTDFYDLTALLQKSTVKFGDFGDIFRKLFETTNQKEATDQETTSLKAEENEKGEVVAITVEKVDSDAGEQAKILLEGLTIVAVNGIMLYDLGTIEDQIAYLVTEKIESLMLAEPNMEATTYTVY